MPEQGDWNRVGELLQQQRVRLDGRYANLSRFARERRLDYRMAWDVEHGARTNYRPPTITAIEVAYGWKPGSIEQVLAGGGPVLAGENADDGRPRFDDDADQAAADAAWEAAPGLPFELRRGTVALAVEMARKRRSSAREELRQRHA